MGTLNTTLGANMASHLLLPTSGNMTRFEKFNLVPYHITMVQLCFCTWFQAFILKVTLLKHLLQLACEHLARCRIFDK